MASSSIPPQWPPPQFLRLVQSLFDNIVAILRAPGGAEVLWCSHGALISSAIGAGLISRMWLLIARLMSCQVTLQLTNRKRSMWWGKGSGDAGPIAARGRSLEQSNRITSYSWPALGQAASYCSTLPCTTNSTLVHYPALRTNSTLVHDLHYVLIVH